MEIVQTALGIAIGVGVVTVVSFVIWRDVRPRRSDGQQHNAQRQRELNEQYGQTGVDREFSAYDRDSRGGES